MKTKSFLNGAAIAGFQKNEAAWTLVSQTAVFGSGAGNETRVNLSPFSLSARETYGIYVTVDEIPMPPLTCITQMALTLIRTPM
jgi:hypothetical protein